MEWDWEWVMESSRSFIEKGRSYQDAIDGSEGGERAHIETLSVAVAGSRVGVFAGTGQTIARSAGEAFVADACPGGTVAQSRIAACCVGGHVRDVDLLGQAEPDEIFGAIPLASERKGRYEKRKEGNRERERDREREGERKRQRERERE
jgi:hypothetical protein